MKLRFCFTDWRITAVLRRRVAVSTSLFPLSSLKNERSSDSSRLVMSNLRRSFSLGFFSMAKSRMSGKTEEAKEWSKKTLRTKEKIDHVLISLCEIYVSSQRGSWIEVDNHRRLCHVKTIWLSRPSFLLHIVCTNLSRVAQSGAFLLIQGMAYWALKSNQVR